MTAKRRLQLDDLLQIEYLSSPVISPNGETALYVVSLGERETGKFAQRIWKADIGAKNAAPLFDDHFRQKLPRFSPDGNIIYYLSDKNSSKNIFQIWKLENGVQTQLTALRHGVSWYSLSPDGKQAVFEAPLWMEGTAPGDTRENALLPMTGEERKNWQKRKDMQPVVIEEVMYKFDETYGIPDGSVSQIGTVSLESGAVKLLTWENIQHHYPVFSPDGKKIACWRMPYGGWKKKRGEITLIDLDGNMTQLTENTMGLGETPVWIDQHTVLYSAYWIKEGDFHGTFYKVSSPEVSSPEEKPVLFFPENTSCWGPGALITGHTAYGYPGESTQLAGETLYYLSVDHGSAGVYSLTSDGRESKLLTPEKCCVQGFSIAGEKLLYIKGTTEHIADLYLLDLSTGKEQMIAHHNHWADKVEMQHPQELLVPASDGKTQIHGWVLKPEGFEDGEKYPAVLDIHGGPECCYPFDWWFEFQYLAARGMAVVWCDPHGSISYGKDYQDGAWDGRAYDDLMTFLDYTIGLGFIDSQKLGVTGGSYGGYMTNCIIGSSTRFAAAVSQRNLCNRATSYGTGDMGSIMEKPFRGCYKSLINRMKGGSTTIKTIDQISTPLLILHATNDYRCSFEQGEQMFIAMKDRRPDIPVRFAAFPGENHSLTREGNIYAQRGHLLEMADWFERYLNAEEER